METIRKLPIKTRLPVMAWALAGITTLFSLAASLAHLDDAPDRSVTFAQHINAATDQPD